METLFRFTLQRVPHRSIEETQRIDLSTDSVFQQRVSALVRDGHWLTQLKRLVQEHRQSEEFISGAASVPEFNTWQQLDQALDGLNQQSVEGSSQPFAIQVRNQVREVLGGDLRAWLSDLDSSALETQLKDSILCIKVEAEYHRLDMALLVNLLRLLTLMETMADNSDFPLDTDSMSRWRRQPLLLPQAFTPRSKKVVSDRPMSGEQTENQLTQLSDHYKKLSEVIEELQAVKPTAFDNSEEKGADSQLPPKKFRPVKLFETEFLIRQNRLSQLLHGFTLTPSSKSRNVLNDNSNRLISGDLSQFSVQNLAKDSAQFQVAPATAMALRGLPEIDVSVLKRSMIFSDEGFKQLSKTTQTLLKSYGLDANDSLSDQISVLQKKKTALAYQARQLLQPFGQTQHQFLGSLRLFKKRFPVANFLTLSPDILLNLFPKFRTVTGSVPTTYSALEPAGEIELLIVKQQLVRYSTADIAAIRNIMQGEFNEQVKRNLRSQEMEYYRETESTVEQETSTETSERFELQREVQETLKEDLAAKGSLTVSGQLGPQFSYQAHGEFGWNKSVENVSKSASEMAREVTQKASEKVTERVLSRQRKLTRTEQEITLTQRTSNDSDQHSVGIYQWLNKVYQAQVFNYGVREVYDLMIPEPGAMLLAMMNRREANALDIEAVEPFNLQPKELEPENYQEFVRLYQAEDILPPPEPFVTVTHNFSSGGGEDPGQRFTHSAKLSIPDGYQAFRASVGTAVTLWDSWGVDVIIGQRSHRFNGGDNVYFTDLDLETESIPVGMVSLNVADIALVVEVICQATERAMELWRLDTYNKLVQAYRLRKSEQDSLIAERSAQLEFQITEFSEAMNKSLMQDEIKRLCISVLTQQHFDHFDAMNDGVANLPEVDFREAELEGRYVRFFEQAFEWENLSWITYPYFWGQKNQWQERVLMEHSDPQFLEFLKAGYVRVVLPVRTGFGAAVDHFRQWGEPWLGGPLPTVSDELYLPLADEIAERLHHSGDELPVGEPWPVVVPTQLVKLRDDTQLPSWRQNEDGFWTDD